jgi:hypothetical protein
MATDALCRISLEADLRSKPVYRDLGLMCLDDPKPLASKRENMLDRVGALSDPLEVIGIPVSFNPAEAAECISQPYEHLSRHPNLTMLAGRHANTVPVRTTLSRARMVGTETSLGVEKASGPSAFNVLRVGF